MRVVKQLILRKVAGEAVLVPVGEATLEFNGLMALTETARVIWENLEKVSGEDELVGILLEEFEVDEDTVRRDVRGFVDALVEYGIAEYTNADVKW